MDDDVLNDVYDMDGLDEPLAPPDVDIDEDLAREINEKIEMHVPDMEFDDFGFIIGEKQQKYKVEPAPVVKLKTLNKLNPHTGSK